MDRKEQGSSSNRDNTWQDEEKMDRVSQSGAEGAFGSEVNSPTRKQTLEDAEQAFKSGDQGGSSQK